VNCYGTPSLCLPPAPRRTYTHELPTFFDRFILAPPIAIRHNNALTAHHLQRIPSSRTTWCCFLRVYIILYDYAQNKSRAEVAASTNTQPTSSTYNATTTVLLPEFSAVHGDFSTPENMSTRRRNTNRHVIEIWRPFRFFKTHHTECIHRPRENVCGQYFTFSKRVHADQWKILNIYF